jgi:hypothetical protein
MTVLSHGFDAAFCPNPVPLEIGGQPIGWCEVYIGGSSAERRNGWSAAELVRVEHMAKLPVWVPTAGVDNPNQAGSACVSALRAFRVPAFATPWRWVLVDLETGAAANQADPAWLAPFRARLEAAGYDTVTYASMSRVCGYPAYSGRLGACWDGVPDLATCAGEHVPCSLVGKQYAAEVHTPGGPVDLDVIADIYLPHLGLWNGPAASAELVTATAPHLTAYNATPEQAQTGAHLLP